MRIPDVYVRVKEAAGILGVCVNTMRTWGADGKVPEYRHPVNNYRLYRKTDLDKMLRRLEKARPVPATRARPRKAR